MSIETYFENLTAYNALKPLISLDDGNYNLQRAPIPFPVYAWNKERFPFIFNRSLYFLPDENRPTDQFVPSDNPKRFEKNLLAQPSDWKYRTKPITYNVNSCGYRTKEWADIDWKNSIVIFGCSCVYGVGVAEDENISYFLEQNTNTPVINMGYPGGSNDLILENIVNLLAFVGPENIPKNIIIGWSTSDRCLYYGDKQTLDVGPWALNNSDKMQKLYVSLFENQYNEMFRAHSIGRTVRQLLEGKTNLVEFSFFPTSAHYMRMKLPPFPMHDKARDLMHPGEKVCKEVADTLMEYINV
jgi:hypothetical protein